MHLLCIQCKTKWTARECLPYAKKGLPVPVCCETQTLFWVEDEE